MREAFLIQLSEWTLLITACIGFAVILVATLYDLQVATRRKEMSRVVKALHKPRQPHVTVLVYVEGPQIQISACLQSIGKSRYRNYDVVIVDNASSSTTKREFLRYQKKHPNASVYLYKKRKVTSRVTALQEGYRKSNQGELILVLDGESTLEPLTMRMAAAHFITSSRLEALQLHTVSSQWQNVQLLLTHFSQLSRHAIAKCFSFLSLYYIPIGGTESMYRASSFMGAGARRKIRARYDNAMTIVSTTQLREAGFFAKRQSSSNWAVRVGALLLSLYVVLLITFFLYAAASLQSSSLLMLSWVVVSVWLATAVWSDETLKIKKKVMLFFCIPPMYFLVYAHIVVYNVTALLKQCWRIVPAKFNFRLRKTI